MKGSPVSVCCVALMIAACAREPSTEGSTEADAAKPGTEAAASGIAAMPLPCLASNPREASAWINKMPGPDASPSLHITFTVDARNSGDVFTLEFRGADRMMPPSYRYALVRTEAGQLPVITPTVVNYQEPDFVEAELTSVKIACDDEMLIEISPVDIVQ
ncbi:MAG: hypothetical protein VX640_02815 [Pseudomonadota bacterium]|nr:hypothetical protein [Pseudomonadota bacterium]